MNRKVVIGIGIVLAGVLGFVGYKIYKKIKNQSSNE